MKYPIIKFILLFCLASFAILATIAVEYLQRHFNDDMHLEAEHTAVKQLQLVRYHLETLITSRVTEATGLASFIAVSPGSDPEQWRKIAEKIIINNRYIRNITVAPHDVIQFVHPLASNESVLGVDFRTLPKQWVDVQRARETQQMQLVGPLKLLQGGEGLIVRLPIFTDPPQNNEYWGGCSVVFDWPQMLEDAGILALAADVKLSIREMDAAGLPGRQLWGDISVYSAPLAAEIINLPSSRWQIVIGDELYLRQNWVESNLIRFLGISLILLAIFSAVLLYQMFTNVHRYSYEDMLTKIGNRRQAMAVLRQLTNSRDRFGIISIDLNDFKQVNDIYGHAAGDRLLQEVATRLKEQVRGSDVVTRIGGDEFLIITPRLKEHDNLPILAEKIRRQVCDSPLYWRGKQLTISLAVGTARYPTDADSLKHLLQFADRAMYEDKSRHKSDGNSATLMD